MHARAACGQAQAESPALAGPRIPLPLVDPLVQTISELFMRRQQGINHLMASAPRRTRREGDAYGASYFDGFTAALLFTRLYMGSARNTLSASVHALSMILGPTPALSTDFQVVAIQREDAGASTTLQGAALHQRAADIGLPTFIRISQAVAAPPAACRGQGRSRGGGV